MYKGSVLDEILLLLNGSISKAELFLSAQPKLGKQFKNLIKLQYDDVDFEKSATALKEIYVDNLDEEQIWQQIELQNDLPLMNITKALASHKISSLPFTLTKPNNELQTLPHSDQSDHEGQLESESEYESECQNEDSEIENESNDDDKIVKKEKKKSDKHKKPSILDDKFFKLNDMNNYILQEDKRELQKNENVKEESDNDSEDTDEESVNLFEDFPDDEEDGSDDGRNIKYADFFDSPDSEGEDNGKRKIGETDSQDLNDKPMLEPLKKKVKFNLNNDSDDTDSLENKGSTQMQENVSEEKTTYEIREEKIRKQMEKFEKENLNEKSWQMKGEVSAKNRPEYSLLEEYLETDITARPPPVITEETTEKLEDIIKRRIKDKAWDDVEKKFKPVETPLEYKKKLVLDQEKSKLSLAQIYENEYLQQKKTLNPDANEDAEPEIPKEHKEIKEELKTIFNKLDALFDYHYTPKQVQPEVKIVSNVPAINMEEVAPLATSDAALLAPEEIKAKPRGDVIGKSERTKTDMKRARRHKKIRQGKIQKAKEQREKEPTLMKKKFNKKGEKSTEEKTASSKTHITSTSFFSQLQDEVQSMIKSKQTLKKIKKPKSVS